MKIQLWRWPFDTYQSSQQTAFTVMFSLLLLLFVPRTTSAQTQAQIIAENQLPGTDQVNWDYDYLQGDTRIMGFATDMSTNVGGTVKFKIRSNSESYKVEIYRIGYYQGKGARKIEDATILTPLPFRQPLNTVNTTTGLIECSNWTVNAEWKVPTSAISGVYIAKLINTGPVETGAIGQIIFVVRNDASTSDLYFKTSDATWQSYNDFGEYSTASANLYYGRYTSGSPTQGELLTKYPAGRAVKVSYDRPFTNRAPDGLQSFFYCSEFPTIRWLERNGYSVSYFTDVDLERNGQLIKNHRTFLSVGHDEYYSAKGRANVEAARDAGVNIAFLSGNEVYWKTRWEAGTDGTANRVLVCYKDGSNGTLCGTDKCDPLPGVWTGKWRNGCEYPNTDGCNPENNLSGQMSYFLEKEVSMQVPASVKDYRFWRSTSIKNLLPGQVAGISSKILGHEIAYEMPEFRYPDGRVKMSETQVIEGIVHKLSLMRHKSGALVFGAGTIRWAWGLDAVHDLAGTPVDIRIQQATVNLLADMNALPGSLQSDLLRATPTTDRQAPLSTIQSPKVLNIPVGQTVNLSGIAVEALGVVAGVDVSTDGGLTWSPATGTSQWTYFFTPTVNGIVDLRVRAYDDMGNVESVFSAANSYKITVGTVVTVPNLQVTIPDAKAYPTGVIPNKVYEGFEAAESITICAVAKNGIAPYTYKWSNGSTKSCITVSPSVKTVYTVTVTDAKGAKMVATKTIEVEDVSVGKKDKYILLCVKGKTEFEKEKQVAKILAQGGTLGACDSKFKSLFYYLVEKYLSENNFSSRATLIPQANITTEMSVKGTPNPSNSYFTLRLSGLKTKEATIVKVTNMEGKVVEVKTIIGSPTVDLGHSYRPGVYFVEAMQSEKRVTTKLIKQ